MSSFHDDSLSEVIDTGYDFERQILEDKALRKKKRIFFGLFVVVMVTAVISMEVINSNSIDFSPEPGPEPSNPTTQDDPTDSSGTTSSVNTGVYTMDASWELANIPADYDIQFCKSVAVYGDRVYVGQDVGTPPIIVLDEYGRWQGGFGEGHVASAHSLSAYDDALFVVDTTNHSVKQFSFSGDLLTIIGQDGTAGSSTDPLQFDRPTGMTFDEEGRVYIADGEGANDRIVVLNSDLSFRATFGSSGTGDAQFDIPHSLVYQEDGRRLWVTHEHNDRVQVFNLDYDVLVGQWASVDGCTMYKPKGVTIDGDYVLISTTDHLDDPAYLSVYVLPLVPTPQDLFSWEGCEEVEEDKVSDHYYHNLATGAEGVYAVDPYDGTCISRFITN